MIIFRLPQLTDLCRAAFQVTWISSGDYSGRGTNCTICWQLRRREVTEGTDDQLHRTPDKGKAFLSLT